MTETPATMTCASVVSRESVRIALTLAALNDLEVKTADIQGAHLTAPVQEKIWAVLGPEFGSDMGKRATAVRALCGLKSAGNAFRSHLADHTCNLGHTPCLADPDVWMKPENRPEDGSHIPLASCSAWMIFCACIMMESVCHTRWINSS